jgi:SnoaL-like domain
MEGRIERIATAFNALNKDNMHILDGFYHADVLFEDPLGRIEGLPDLKDYYAQMYENVQSIGFGFTNQIVDGDTHVAVWTMRMRAKGLNKGSEVILDGISLIRFGENDLVVYHRDYFDVGAMVYEQVPVVRFFVRH